MMAKTFMGLEPILSQELTELGANNIVAGRRVVFFTGDKAMMYRANMQLRTAIRILKPIKHFTASTADEVYENVKQINWSDYLDVKQTFAVDSVVYSDDFHHSKFVAYKVKDAIVDQFRDTLGTRPNVSVTNPDIRLHIHIADNDCTLCLDSSGASLHRRGYRQEGGEAPVNESLAAGLILMTGWHGDKDFIDPMCGSGTFLIEAALIALNMAPGLFHREYAFEKWPDFDQNLFDEIYNDDSKEREFTHHIYGYDIDIKAVNTAKLNIKAAGLSKYITVAQQDFKDFKQPSEPAIMVTNPPYGQRISTPDLLGTYDMIGQQLKHNFKGNDAWVLSYNEECFDAIGLRPSLKIPVYNGSLECEFRKYQMFEGKLSDYREAGNILKTDEEKQLMAETKHHKKSRGDFKKHLEEIENDESDIRSFEFRKYNYVDQYDRRDRRGSRDYNDRRGDRDYRDRRESRGYNSDRNDRGWHDRRDNGRDDRRSYGRRDYNDRDRGSRNYGNRDYNSRRNDYGTRKYSRRNDRDDYNKNTEDE